MQQVERLPQDKDMATQNIDLLSRHDGRSRRHSLCGILRSTWSSRWAARVSLVRMPVRAMQLKRTVEVLDDGGAILHPVAGVAVEHAVALDDRWRVQVSADDPVAITAAGMVQQRRFETADEAYKLLDALLHDSTQPVGAL